MTGSSPAGTPPPTTLIVDCVGKSFGTRRVLTSATLRADAGTITALLGRNGAGKSTLLAIAAGWLQPDHGIVRFRGETYVSPRLHQLAAAGLFYLPQRDLLTSSLTVGDQLRIVASAFGTGDRGEAAAAAAAVESAAATVGIDRVLGRRPQQLSGGELRRSEIAAALVRAPACLLADEPYRGVAPFDAEVLTAAFRRLAGDGCAIVVTGHEVPTLLDAADCVVWCTGGTTESLGPPDRARENWGFRREYLGR